jgi:hypothetical protein
VFCRNIGDTRSNNVGGNSEFSDEIHLCCMMGKFYLEKIQQKQKSKNVKNERESLTDYIEYFYLEMQLRKSTQKSDFRVSI